jgi:hypothetical protein
VRAKGRKFEKARGKRNSRGFRVWFYSISLLVLLLLKFRFCLHLDSVVIYVWQWFSVLRILFTAPLFSVQVFCVALVTFFMLEIEYLLSDARVCLVNSKFNPLFDMPASWLHKKFISIHFSFMFWNQTKKSDFAVYFVFLVLHRVHDHILVAQLHLLFWLVL